MFEMVLLRNAKVKKRYIMFKMVLLKNAEVKVKYALSLLASL